MLPQTFDLQTFDFSTFDSFYLFFCLGSFSFCLLSSKVTFDFLTFDFPTKKDTLGYLLHYKKIYQIINAYT